MRKVIGIGETILDIIFRGDQPSAAVPGGSVFNGIVSLGRMGINVGFISETGNDRVGNIILQFMRDNNIPPTMSMYSRTVNPRITRFSQRAKRCGIYLLQRLPQTTPGRGVPQTGRRRHRHDRLLLCLKSGIARKGSGTAGTRARRKPSSTTTPISVRHTKTRRSSWLPPSSRIWNMPTLYAAHRGLFLYVQSKRSGQGI